VAASGQAAPLARSFQPLSTGVPAPRGALSPDAASETRLEASKGAAPVVPRVSAPGGEKAPRRLERQDALGIEDEDGESEIDFDESDGESEIELDESDSDLDNETFSDLETDESDLDLKSDPSDGDKNGHEVPPTISSLANDVLAKDEPTVLATKYGDVDLPDVHCAKDAAPSTTVREAPINPLHIADPETQPRKALAGDVDSNDEFDDDFDDEFDVESDDEFNDDSEEYGHGEDAGANLDDAQQPTDLPAHDTFETPAIFNNNEELFAARKEKVDRTTMREASKSPLRVAETGTPSQKALTEDNDSDDEFDGGSDVEYEDEYDEESDDLSDEDGYEDGSEKGEYEDAYSEMDIEDAKQSKDVSAQRASETPVESKEKNKALAARQETGASMSLRKAPISPSRITKSATAAQSQKALNVNEDSDNESDAGEYEDYEYDDEESDGVSEDDEDSDFDVGDSEEYYDDYE